MNIFSIYLLAGLTLGLLILYLGYGALVIALGLPLGLLVISAFPVGATKVSATIRQLRWFHLLWLLLLLSGLVFRIREADAAVANPLDFWGLFRICLVGLVGFVLLFRLVMRQPDWLFFLGKGYVGFLTCYAIFALMSTFWSVYPAWTFYKSIEYLVDLALIAGILATVKTPEEFKTLFDWTWILLSCLVGSVWLGTIIWPEQAIFYGSSLLGFQIKGVLPAIAANGVGQLGALLTCVTFVRIILGNRQNWFYHIIFVGAVITMILAQSRSSLTGALVGMSLVFFVSKRKGPVFLTLVVMLAVLALTPVSDVFLEFFQRGQNAQQFSSLTGRVTWWTHAWDLFMERPITGYGAYAGSRFAVLAEIGAHETSSLHNTWLELLIGSGLLSFFLVLIPVLCAWVTLSRVTMHVHNDGVRYALAVEALGILAVLSVRSFFSSAFIWHPPLSFLLVLGYAEFLRRTRRKSSRYENITSS